MLKFTYGVLVFFISTGGGGVVGVGVVVVVVVNGDLKALRGIKSR